MDKLQCPKCFSFDTYKNGSNKLKTGEIKARYFCMNCKKNFSIIKLN